MSSNMKILKRCEYCKQEFVAKTTVTKCCSDYCAKRLYKLKQREKKITVAVVNEERKQNQKSVITEEEIKSIQVKEYLTLKEAAFLLKSQATQNRVLSYVSNSGRTLCFLILICLAWNWYNGYEQP